MESLENNTLIATLLSIYGNLLGKAELRRAEKHYLMIYLLQRLHKMKTHLEMQYIYL